MPVLQASHPFMLNHRTRAFMAGEIRLGPSRPAVVSPRRQKPSLAQSAASPLLTTHLADPFSKFCECEPRLTRLQRERRGQAVGKPSAWPPVARCPQSVARFPQPLDPGDAVSTTGAAPPPQSGGRGLLACAGCSTFSCCTLAPQAGRSGLPAGAGHSS